MFKKTNEEGGGRVAGTAGRNGSSPEHVLSKPGKEGICLTSGVLPSSAAATFPLPKALARAQTGDAQGRAHSAPISEAGSAGGMGHAYPDEKRKVAISRHPPQPSSQQPPWIYAKNSKFIANFRRGLRRPAA